MASPEVRIARATFETLLVQNTVEVSQGHGTTLEAMQKLDAAFDELKDALRAEFRAKDIELTAAIKLMMPYLAHRSSCTYGDGSPVEEFCDCNVGAVVTYIRQLVGRP